MKKKFTTTIDKEILSKIEVISFKLSIEKKKRIYINDLIEEAFQLLIEKYENIDNF